MGAVINKLFCEDDLEGYHILNICEDSPAQVVGLEAYFDFIVAICGVKLNGRHNVLLSLLHQNAGKQIILNVYSLRTHKLRDVRIIPNLEWGIQGLLGVTIRFCSVREAFNCVHHILEVHPGSPAEKAGLRPFSDYIIGAEYHSDYIEINPITLITKYDGRELKIFLYNCDDDTCRAVVIKPDSKWGGKGFIGCDIGIGYLHRIPSHIQRSVTNSISIKTTSSETCNTIIDIALSVETEIISPTILYVPPLRKTESVVDLDVNIQMEPIKTIDRSHEDFVEKSENISLEVMDAYPEIDIEKQDRNEKKYVMMMP